MVVCIHGLWQARDSVSQGGEKFLSKTEGEEKKIAAKMSPGSQKVGADVIFCDRIAGEGEIKPP